jgi:hypothetical protein
MNRREATRYLTLGVTAAAITGDWGDAGIARTGLSDDRASRREPASGGRARLCAVIRDVRYADARRFAEGLGGRSAMLLATVGDPVTLWRAECRLRLRSPAWRLAGMTTYSDFLLLRGCARECGASVIYQAVHDFRREPVLHVISAGESSASLASALRHDDWTAWLAQALLRAPLRASPIDERSIRAVGGRPASDHPGTLVSWMIAAS